MFLHVIPAPWDRDSASFSSLNRISVTCSKCLVLFILPSTSGESSVSFSGCYIEVHVPGLMPATTISTLAIIPEATMTVSQGGSLSIQISDSPIHVAPLSSNEMVVSHQLPSALPSNTSCLLGLLTLKHLLLQLTTTQ